MNGMTGMIYLASPYSHVDQLVCEARFREVCLIASRLLRIGLMVYSPIAHTHPITMVSGGNLNLDWKQWEQFDSWFIERCGALWVADMEGWRESVGVQAEIKLARRCGKIVKLLTLPGLELVKIRES